MVGWSSSSSTVRACWGLAVVGMAMFSFLQTLHDTNIFPFPSMPFAAFTKCWPILALILILAWTNGVSSRYSLLINIGLVFSLFGDFFLVLDGHQYFLHGLISFAIAHVLYIGAFGWQPIRAALLFVVVPICICISLVLLPHVKRSLMIPVIIYILLLGTMTYRAIAGYEKSSVSRQCSTIGALLFALSDLILGFNRFVSPIPLAKTCIIVLYYAAQVLMTHSAARWYERVQAETKRDSPATSTRAKSMKAQ